MDNEKISDNEIAGGPQGNEPKDADFVYTNPESSIYAYTDDINSKGAKQKRPHKKISSVLVIILIIICLLGGTVLGTLVIAPNINWISEQFSSAYKKPAENTIAPKETPTNAIELPEIGGPTPQINVSGEDGFVQVVKTAGPAVVGISTSSERQIGSQKKEVIIGAASGFIITQDGYIVTNQHVVATGEHINVTLNDGTEYKAKLIGSDATSDLAVIKIDAQNLTAAALGDSDALQVGEKVLAIGNPLGENAGSVTAGIVSGLNREIEGFSLKCIQTDAAFNPGNSGGPLVDMNASVVGINTLKITRAGYDDYGMPIGSEGLGYAIPISTAKPIIMQLIETGSMPHPFIGIECIVDTAAEYNSEDAPLGVTVITVVREGPADLALIMPRDIILSVDGIKTETVQTLLDIINSKQIGDKMNVTLWRAGQEYLTTVVIGNRNDM